MLSTALKRTVYEEGGVIQISRSLAFDTVLQSHAHFREIEIWLNFQLKRHSRRVLSVSEKSETSPLWRIFVRRESSRGQRLRFRSQRRKPGFGIASD
jgi:hypothetical protein